MRNQTIKFAKGRLARFDTNSVYSFEIGVQGLRRRSGVVRITKKES